MNFESAKLEEYKKNLLANNLKICSEKDYIFRDSRHTQLCRMCRRHTILTPEVLNRYIVELFKYCLTHRVDSYRIHMDRIKGIKLLLKITNRTDYNDLKLAQIVGIIWSSLSVAHHFYLRLASESKGYTSWKRDRRYYQSLIAIERVLTMLLPQLFSIVIESIVRFFSEARLWDMEPFIISIFKRFLCVFKSKTFIIHYLLDILENSAVKESRSVLKVLYILLKFIEWKEMDEVLMKRLLLLYRSMVQPPPGEESFWALKKSVELCIKHTLQNMKQMDIQNVIYQILDWVMQPGVADSIIIDYGCMLEFAASLHDKDTNMVNSIPDNVFKRIMVLISSKEALLNLLGTRILQYLLDTQNNNMLFKTARIFFNDDTLYIPIAEYQSENKNFLKLYRKVLHLSLVQSIENHGNNVINLESTYTCIALLVVEVPCGYTAAAVVCLSMAIQEFALESETWKLEVTNKIHAVVMSILSLVCYVHRAKVFYDYLNTILYRRAANAPHLNPPLLDMYIYAQHHIKWAKPELFFEDWEVRYGLWKCFVTSTKSSMCNVKDMSINMNKSKLSFDTD